MSGGCRADSHCRVARLERQEFQNLIRDSKEASAMILQTMNDRLMRAQKYATTVPSSRVAHPGNEIRYRLPGYSRLSCC